MIFEEFATYKEDRTMKRMIKIILLLAGMVMSGIWIAAYGQTGDCYVTLPGCLDVSFGVNGKVTTPAGMTVNGVAIQYVRGELRIVAVGYISAPKTYAAWTVVRYRENGDLDTTFGSGGIVKQVFKKGSAYARAVVVQPDNKLVVVGDAPPAPGRQNVAAVARYKEDGSPDSTFGTGGFVTVPCVSYPRAFGSAGAVTLQLDLKIVAAGVYLFPNHLAVFRLNYNDTLDTTFKGTGQYVYPGAYSHAGGVTVQWVGSEERIVAAGAILDQSYDKAALLRFTSNGQLDTSFGGSGIVLTDFAPNNDYYEAVAVDSSNRLVATGNGETWGDPNTIKDDFYQLVLARYNVDGTLDPSFGTLGKVIPLPRLVSEAASAIGIQPDGKILLAGDSWSVDRPYMAIWRFDENGSADMSFGSSGWVTTDFGSEGSSSNAFALALQPDGKFVVGGSAKVNGNWVAALARYWQ